ncbi:MAG: hypothetical protein J3K34DRAFT_278168 [Monoraphidium minutum]|nr:MAG: hypothetical protein J3K34DRAFT_278168 [Monoraphidium minutum]
MAFSGLRSRSSRQGQRAGGRSRPQSRRPAVCVVSAALSRARSALETPKTTPPGCMQHPSPGCMHPGCVQHPGAPIGCNTQVRPWIAWVQPCMDGRAPRNNSRLQGFSLHANICRGDCLRVRSMRLCVRLCPPRPPPRYVPGALLASCPARRYQSP